MLKKLNNIEEFEEYLRGREVEASSEVIKNTQDIINKVKKEKDNALIELTEKFDGVKLDSIKVSYELNWCILFRIEKFKIKLE